MSRQLVFSPEIMQFGVILIVLSNWALFIHVKYELNYRFIMAFTPWECVYYSLHSVGAVSVCFGAQARWSNLSLVMIMIATPILYVSVPGTMVLVYVVQVCNNSTS